MKSVRKLFNKINIDGQILFNEPLSSHSTFRIGGNADVFIRAASVNDLIKIKQTASEEGVPLYPLGEGANILFPDRGYRGVILDTSGLYSFKLDYKSDFSSKKILVKASAGVKISSLAEVCTMEGLAGLENFYGMPGYIGGSVYMNARCYGVSLSDRIESVFYLDENCDINEYIYNENDFDYKKSPFQDKNVIITGALFSLIKNNSGELLNSMYSFKDQRKAKGHYLYPCAGSVFKNNRDFGEPSGKIIDRLGLRGYSIGGAMVSEKHANIIVNRGNATEKDIKNLIDYIYTKVFESFGFSLEREIIYVDGGGK